MIKPLLIEIGVEELPAIPFLKELPNIEKKWLNILEKYNLITNFKFFYTPRRLVLWHREFALKQPNMIKEFIGAPLKVAYDKDNNPTKACIGFAKKCGVKVEELSKIEKNNREVLYYQQEIEGRNSQDLIANMLEEFINSLHFGKTMKWGTLNKNFIRPIRWFNVMLENQNIDFELFGLKSNNQSYGHRNISYKPFDIDFAGDYFCKLLKNGVILYQDERKEKILTQFKEIEKTNNIKIEIDEDLLNEIVAITEYPTALIGKFDKELLELPDEVIITSMKEHQRYFPVKKDGKLVNNFIVVSNSYTENFEKIIAGNEKVLKARLQDGLFFYHNDLKNGFNTDGLKKILFMQGAGTVYDKELREVKIGLSLVNNYILELKNETLKSESELNQLIEKTILLSKADLMTEVVYEFTELQGLMGFYYAQKFGEDDLLSYGLKEQYFPVGENSELPTSTFSSIIALSNKLDTLMTLFSLNKIPTGSKDPFALRRAVLGIIKIILDKNLTFNIDSIIDILQKDYKEFDLKILKEFFKDRFYQIYNDINPSIIKSVLLSGENDIIEISKKIQALNIIVNSDGFRKSFTTFKRVANITKDINLDDDLIINENLFETNFEKDLYSKWNLIIGKSYLNYEEKLDAMFNIKFELDNFFDNVLVNAENEELKNTRKNLIANIYKEFKKIADIKEITI